MPESVDLIIRGWYVVTMNEARDVIRDGAVAVRGSTIVAVGKAVDIERDYVAARSIGGDRFVVTPGMVNTHIHITGEPLTRGYVPDDTPFEENVFQWLCPLYAAFDAADERTSAQRAAARGGGQQRQAHLHAERVVLAVVVVEVVGEHELSTRSERADRPGDERPRALVALGAADVAEHDHVERARCDLDRVEVARA